MTKEKILDELYTARWCLNQTPPKIKGAVQSISDAINGVSGADVPDTVGDPKDSGTPNENDPLSAVLVVVVGHEKKAPGADFALGASEYQFNSDIAARMKIYAAAKFPNLRVEIIFRDGIGIGGAYRKASALTPDACIELHFNAYNNQASGSETLSSVDAEDQRFAGIIHNHVCKVFERPGKSRGVKVLSRSGRGGQSLYSLPGSANCLVEPFFGDNMSEAKFADAHRGEYAAGLIDGVIEWCKVHGLA